MANKITTFFERVGSWLKKLFKISSWEHQALATITYVAPLVETIVTLAAGGPAALIVTNVINMVKADLATVATVVQDGTPVKGSSAEAAVVTALNSVKTNLSSLLTAAEVKNSTKAADITATVNLITGETDALLGSMGGTVPAAPSPAPAAPA